MFIVAGMSVEVQLSALVCDTATEYEILLAAYRHGDFGNWALPCVAGESREQIARSVWFRTTFYIVVDTTMFFSPLEFHFISVTPRCSHVKLLFEPFFRPLHAPLLAKLEPFVCRIADGLLVLKGLS